MARAHKQRAEIEQTRDRILDAAARAFARSGFGAATMAAIAKEAGYTAPTLYTYFKGKRAIYEGLIALVTRELLASYELPVPAGLTFRQHLELLLSRQLAVVDQRSDAFAFFLSLSSGSAPSPGRGKRRSRDEGDVLFERRAAWIAAHTDDALRQADPELLATFLDGVGSALLLRWVKGGRRHPAVALVPQMVALFFHGAIGAIET